MPPRAHDDCDLLLDALSAGEALPAPLEEHARRCPRCGPLTRVGALLDVPLGPPLAMSPALHEALHDARPAPRRSSLARAAPTLLVAAGAVVAQRLAGAQQHAPSAATALLLAGAGAGLALVFWRGADGVGSPARWRRGYPVFAAVLALLAARVGAAGSPFGPSLGSRALSPGTAFDGVSRLQGTGADEVTAAAATAVIVTVITATTTLLGARRTTPNLPALSGATAGAAAALLGLAVAHQGALGPGVALGHVALVVAASVLASIVGRASLAP